MSVRIGATPLAREFNGTHLRKVRVFDRGYTLKELAGKCGCSEQAISQYERGKRSMDVYTCKRILNALQCTPHDVLCKDDQAIMIAEFSEHEFVYIGAEHISGASVNTSRTMGKTPEEIKKSLKYCSSYSDCSDDCPHYTDARCTLLADALVYIQQLEAQAPKWISVEDRLPERQGDCLVLYSFGETNVQGFAGVMYFIRHDERPHFENDGLYGLHVTHWMPLPQLPKEG